MKLRNLLGYLRPQWRAPQSCEACGQPFRCGASLADCWCEEIALSAEVRAELGSRYQRCLCRGCLERFAAEPEARNVSRK